jgi:hypothetical protein
MGISRAVEQYFLIGKFVGSLIKESKKNYD